MKMDFIGKNVKVLNTNTDTYLMTYKYKNLGNKVYSSKDKSTGSIATVTNAGHDLYRINLGG